MKTEDHERIIDVAFGPKSDGPHLNERDLVTLKHASRGVDSFWTGQSRTGSYQHAMRGWGQSAADAEARAKAFVTYHLRLAADLQHGGSHDLALLHLGKGMHTIADSYSPEHEGFKLWCGDQLWCIPTIVVHVVREDTRNMSAMNHAAAMALRRYYEKFRELSGLGP